jgi:hypothetical protein
MHQKCSNFTLTNLLLVLCRSMWIIELLVTRPSPIPELRHVLLPLKCYELESTPKLLLLQLSSPFDLQSNPSRSLGVCQFIIICNFIVVCKFRIKMRITIVVIKCCCIKFTKLIPMIWGRPRWLTPNFAKSNLFHNLIACNILIVFPRFPNWSCTFYQGI